MHFRPIMLLGAGIWSCLLHGMDHYCYTGRTTASGIWLSIYPEFRRGLTKQSHYLPIVVSLLDQQQ